MFFPSCIEVNLYVCLLKFFFSFQWGADYSRVIRPPTGLKNAADPVDLGFKPHGLKWKGKNAITTRQLNQQRVTRQKKDNVDNLPASQPSVQLSQTSSSRPTKST